MGTFISFSTRQVSIGLCIMTVLMLCALSAPALAAFGFGKKQQEQDEAYAALIEQGSFEQAAEVAESMLSKRSIRKEKSGDINPRALLIYLEMANALRLSGQDASAVERFDLAESAIKEYETRMAGAGGVEAVGAALLGSRVKRYRPKASDGILVNTYKALAFLVLGRSDDARVELHRADERTRRAVELFAKEIEQQQKKKQEQEQEQEQKESENLDGQVTSMLAEHYADLEQWEVYDDFVNPYTVFLHAIYFFSSAQSPSDIEDALTSIKRVAGMNPGNMILAEDLTMMESVATGQFPRSGLPDLVWLICEDGGGPRIDEMQVDFALPVENKAVPVKLSIPQFVAGVPGVSGCAVSKDGKLLQASEIASMDRIAVTEFKKRLPKEIIQSISGLLVRGAVQNELQKNAGVAGALIGLVYQKEAASTETRTWDGLPRAWYAIRIERPADGHLEVFAPSGNRLASLEIPPARIALVHLRSPSAQGRVGVAVAVLSPAP